MCFFHYGNYWVKKNTYFNWQMSNEVSITQEKPYLYNQAFERCHETHAAFTSIYFPAPRQVAQPSHAAVIQQHQRKPSLNSFSHFASLLMQFSFQSSHLGTTGLCFPTYRRWWCFHSKRSTYTLNPPVAVPIQGPRKALVGSQRRKPQTTWGGTLEIKQMYRPQRSYTAYIARRNNRLCMN